MYFCKWQRWLQGGEFNYEGGRKVGEGRGSRDSVYVCEREKNGGHECGGQREREREREAFFGAP